jgi:hypothetical protein
VGENVFDLLIAGFRVLRSPINPGPDKAITVTSTSLPAITTYAGIEMKEFSFSGSKTGNISTQDNEVWTI